MLIVLLVVLLTPEQDYSYNGFAITKAACTGSDLTCYYVAFAIRDKPYTISFYNHPQDVDNITVTATALRLALLMEEVENNTVYIAVPPDVPGQYGVAGVALARIMGTRYGIMNLNVKGAAYGKDAGEINCSHATPQTVVVVLQPSVADAVGVPVPGCIVMTATSPDMAIAVSEAFTYRMLGVIPTFVRAPKDENTSGNSTNGTLL